MFSFNDQERFSGDGIDFLAFEYDQRGLRNFLRDLSDVFVPSIESLQSSHWVMWSKPDSNEIMLAEYCDIGTKISSY